jgi:hypothetical protein
LIYEEDKAFIGLFVRESYSLKFFSVGSCFSVEFDQNTDVFMKMSEIDAPVLYKQDKSYYIFGS